MRQACICTAYHSAAPSLAFIQCHSLLTLTKAYSLDVILPLAVRLSCHNTYPLKGAHTHTHPIIFGVSSFIELKKCVRAKRVGPKIKVSREFKWLYWRQSSQIGAAMN
jgi:hypothetical protein